MPAETRSSGAVRRSCRGPGVRIELVRSGEVGHLRAAELILLGSPFDAERARELGLVTRVVADHTLLQIATETARQLAAKPAGALQASKRLMKRAVREQIKAAMKAENEGFSRQVRSDEAREALTAFLEKRRPKAA